MTYLHVLEGDGAAAANVITTCDGGLVDGLPAHRDVSVRALVAQHRDTHRAGALLDKHASLLKRDYAWVCTMHISK